MYREGRSGRGHEPVQLTSRLTRAFVLTLFAVHPWVIGPRGYNDITAVKLRFFAAVFSLYLAALLVRGAAELLRGRARIRRPRIRALELAAAAYIAAALVSALASGNIRESLLGSTARNEGFFVRSMYALTAALTARFYRPDRRDILVLCAAAACVSAYGILEFFGLDPLGLLPADYFTRYGGRVLHVAAMSNIDVYSTWASMALCAGVVMAVRERGGARAAFLACAAVTAAALALCRVLSGLAGVAAAFAALTPWLVSRRPGRRLLAAWYGAVAAAGVAGCALLPVMAEKTGSAELSDMAALLRGELRDTFGSRRGMIWKRAWALWRGKPLFGRGPDGFRGAYLSRWGVFESEGRLALFDKAHNEYLQTLVDMGAAGLSAYLALLICAIRGAWRELRGNAVSFAALAAVICFAAQGMFNISSPFAHPVAWALVGISCAAPGARRAEDKSENIH